VPEKTLTFYVTSFFKHKLSVKKQLPYEERDLLQQIAEGNELAFRELLQLYGERFYAVALKMTRSEDVAKDMVQDVFTGIWEKRQVLKQVQNPSSYFFTIIYRRIYSHYRKMASERNALQEVFNEPKHEGSAEESVFAKESRKLMNAAIAQLPPKQQQVFRLSKEDGLSREDIARQLKVSPNTVRNQLADAMKSIKVYLLKTYRIFIVLFFFLKKDYFG